MRRKIHQFDVNNVFLHEDLHEEVYMKAPPGLSVLSPSRVCKLKKSLYGLKQASRQWYSKLFEALQAKGFHHSHNDHSLFLKKTAASLVIVAIYVDDILVIWNDLIGIISLKGYLDEQFKIKDLGYIHYFLELEYNEVKGGMVLHQQKFIKELRHSYSVDSLTAVSAPLASNLKLLMQMEDPLPDPTVYRQLVGKLNFLMYTRPDISFSTQLLSQFNQVSCKAHYEAAIHVLRYLKGTALQGLYLNDSPSFKLEAFCDADWAACPNTRRSVSGYFVLFGGSPISWKSKKQVTISLSSAEAEYRSMRRVCSELAWLSRLFTEFEVQDVVPIPLKCDNQEAIYIASNPVFHERTKHIEIECHFVREKLQNGHPLV